MASAPGWRPRAVSPASTNRRSKTCAPRWRRCSATSSTAMSRPQRRSGRLPSRPGASSNASMTPPPYRDHLNRDLPAALGDGWTALTEGMTVRHVQTRNARPRRRPVPHACPARHPDRWPAGPCRSPPGSRSPRRGHRSRHSARADEPLTTITFVEPDTVRRIEAAGGQPPPVLSAGMEITATGTVETVMSPSNTPAWPPPAQVTFQVTVAVTVNTPPG